MEKIAPYSSRKIQELERVGFPIKIEKLLGKDGKPTGYMVLEAEDEIWGKLADNGIYVYTLAYRSGKDEEWSEKKRRPKSIEPTKGFKKFLAHLISMDNLESEGFSKESEVGIIVRALDVEGEILLKSKGKILELAENGYIKAIYPLKDWNDGDCMHFKVLAKYRSSKWEVKTKFPFRKEPPEASFNHYVNAVNNVQENRWEGSVYDGWTEKNRSNPGLRRYSDPKTIDSELDKEMGA